MRIFGIDPGSHRTGYGCVETRRGRHHLVTCGAITAISGESLPDRLVRIHRELTRLLSTCRPECVAIESLFHAANAQSALKLGHARGVAMLAAVQAGCAVAEYTPAEVKRAIVGYGRAEKQQVQHMVRLLLGLEQSPSPHDAADALAIAICHLHSQPPSALDLPAASKASGVHGGSTGAPSSTGTPRRTTRTWRQYRPPAHG